MEVSNIIMFDGGGNNWNISSLRFKDTDNISGYDELLNGTRKHILSVMIQMINKRLD